MERPDTCECPDSGISHGAHCCPAYPYLLVIRDGKQIWVCGECILSTDTDLTTYDDNGQPVWGDITS